MLFRRSELTSPHRFNAQGAVAEPGVEAGQVADQILAPFQAREACQGLLVAAAPIQRDPRGVRIHFGHVWLPPDHLLLGPPFSLLAGSYW